MPVSVEFSAIGDPVLKDGLRKAITDALSSVGGDWRVSLVGSRNNDIWQVKVRGPNVNRDYKLHGIEGQHRPEFLRTLLAEYFRAEKPDAVTAIDISSDVLDRILRRAPSIADIHKVMRALSKAWALSPTDPQVFEEFLARQGVKIRYKSPDKSNVKLPSASEMSRFRQLFEAEWHKVARDTEVLVEHLVASPFLIEFLDELRNLSSNLRELVYRTAIKGSGGQAKVLVLVAISRESPRLWEETLNALARDPVIDSFRMFINDPTSSLSLGQATSEVESGSEGTIEKLFQLSSLGVVDQQRAISALKEANLKLLLGYASALFDLLPDVAFGSFALNRLAVFLCFAEPEAEQSLRASDRLVSALHPTTVDVLVSMRKPHLLKKAFAELPENITERQVMYAAKLIDAIRSGPLEILNEGSARLGKWSQSKLPLLAVAAQAAMVRLNQAGKAQFNKTLLRIARADKSNAIGFWLENNSEIIDLIDIERLPARTWKYLLACYAVREPNKVEKLLASHIKGAHRSKYLKEAIQALSTVQSPNADFILESLLGRELHKGIDDELRKDESIARVVRKYFWLIMETIEEPAKLELFDAITSKIEVRETFSFLQSGVNQGHRQSNEALLNCIASAFVPRALSKGRIGSAEVQQFSDDLFKQTIAFSLVEQSMKDWVFLTHFPGAWQTRRTELKKHISSRVETGLQIGLLNSQRDSALRSNLERLVRDVRSWIDRDSPAIDRSLEIAQNMGIPQKLSENVPTLETFFLRQPSHPQELILFLAQNGWALPYLATQRGAWPTFNVILDQLTKSFVFIKGLRTRGEAEIADLNTSILTDLAISIRSSVSNIEEQLAGYFAFRQILSELGIQPVSAELGAAVSENELGTEEGRSLREPGRQGKYRIFSLGMKVKKKVVDVAIAAKSGVEDDRD